MKGSWADESGVRQEILEIRELFSDLAGLMWVVRHYRVENRDGQNLGKRGDQLVQAPI